jgi:cysteine-rich repeat protein
MVLLGLALAAVVAVALARRFAAPQGSIGRLVGLGSDCGDGQLDSGEECDDGNGRNDDGCLADCRRPRCGDGFVRAHVEECDDGNTVDGDGCSRACLSCPRSGDRFSWEGNGHCYFRVDSAATFDEAAAACRREGAHLAAYADDHEWEAITERLRGGGAIPVWIGLREEERNGLREFAWASGERVLSAHWSVHEPRLVPPGLDCGVQLATGAWSAAACDERRAYLCEKAAWIASPRNHHLYRGFVSPTPWEEAHAACAASGGHLVTLASLDEQAWVTTRFQGTLWMGARLDETSRKFRWVNGEPFAYSDFAPGEPDLPQAQKCLALDLDRRWYSRVCSGQYNFVCEVE